MGVTGPELLTKKTLPELILPVEERIAGVVGFLEASDPSVARNVVEISDIFGPAITIPELRCIVGSQETEKGCVAINQRRTEIGMEELDIHLIHIIEAEETRQEETTKPNRELELVMLELQAHRKKSGNPLRDFA